MSADPLQTGLSPKLDEILSQIPDRAYAGKLRKVYLAASNAISRLSDLDLVKYENASVETSADLSFWEEMAPVIRDTVVDVNGLLLVIREQFPAHPPGGLGATLHRAVEEAGGQVDVRRAQEAEAALQEAAQQLAHQVTHLGEQMRSPSVVSDRWNLLANLEEFRTRFREQIGSMVYATAAAFGEVHRKDVVPFYKQEVTTAVVLRSTLADLNRIVGSRLERVREAEPEDVQWNAQQMEKELDTFGRTPAYRALRAPDKRQVIEFRQKLADLALRPSAPKKDLLALVEPFAGLIQRLATAEASELLRTHDIEVCASCGVKLERAQQLLATDPAGAAALLAEAGAEAKALYGRESELDAFLRAVRKKPLGSLSGPELAESLDRFIGLIAAVPML